MSTHIAVHGFADLVEELMNESDEALTAHLTKPGASVLRLSIISSPEPQAPAASDDSPLPTTDTGSPKLPE